MRLYGASITYRAARGVFRILTTLLLDLKVYGAELVPETGGVLLVANHESFLDPPLVGVKVRRAVSYLAKSELFENPIIGRILRALHGFPLRQGAGDVGAVREAINRLKEGYVLTIFPEGSRTLDGQLQRIEPGVGLIVRRADVPVVPVFIEGSFEAWPKKDLLFHPHRCRVYFRPPMNLSHLKAAEIVATIDRVFHEMETEARAHEAGERANS